MATVGVRAADDDRRRVADRLRSALADGRLTLPEYDERVGAAFAARTYGDLADLVADLPPAPTPPARPAARLPLALGVVWVVWAAVLAVNAACWALASAAEHRMLFPWPLWVAAPTGAALVVATIGTRLLRQHRT